MIAGAWRHESDQLRFHGLRRVGCGQDVYGRGDQGRAGHPATRHGATPQGTSSGSTCTVSTFSWATIPCQRRASRANARAAVNRARALVCCPIAGGRVQRGAAVRASVQLRGTECHLGDAQFGFGGPMSPEHGIDVGSTDRPSRAKVAQNTEQRGPAPNGCRCTTRTSTTCWTRRRGRSRSARARRCGSKRPGRRPRVCRRPVRGATCWKK